MTEPLIFLDPFPRTEAMTLDGPARAELEAMGRIVEHWGSAAPDALIEEHIGEIEIAIGQTAFDADRLARAPKLRAIVNVEGNWRPNIDYAAARARGVRVLSIAPAMAPSVAEFCLERAIALLRDLGGADRAFREGREAYGIAGNQRALSLFGKRVALIGYGNLGRALAPLLRPFGVTLLAHDPWLSPGYLEGEGLVPATLDDALSHAQVLFLLAGVTARNEGFLDAAKLSLISPEAAVILASRAEIVDFDALLALAGEGRIRLAVDVFPEEPAPAASPWREIPNVLYSAHLAGGLEASYARLRDYLIDDVRQILRGAPPLRLQEAEPGLAAIARSR